MTSPTAFTSPPLPGRDRSEATRLMCAGTYCDPRFRDAVIKELKSDWYRQVAPAYGYDAVPVLAHALAARQLRSLQTTLTAAAGGLLLLLWLVGPVDLLDAVLFFGFAAWTLSFLRRLTTLETLVTRLKPRSFTGAVPQTPGLTEDLVGRISAGQVVGDVVYYGGYKPFVGAGVGVKEWSNAQLLVPARVDPLTVAVRGRAGGANGANGANGAVAAADGHGAGRIKEFTIDEITSFTERYLAAVLHDETEANKKVAGLTIERARYRKMLGFGESTRDGASSSDSIHWREEYDAAREYLCVRVGSWNQELVTSIFVGFDIKGGTLHTEFHTYVLAPINAVYHLVDRLPDEFGPGLVLRAAWDALKAVVAEAFAPIGAAIGLIGRLLNGRGGRGTADSDLNLPAYALPVADRGAVVSVRELAAGQKYLHYFQETDASKYMKIIERRLLECIETFLRDHDVDLADHSVFQNTILGDVITHHGTGNVSSRNSGTQTQGDSSPISNPARAEKPKAGKS